MTPAAQISRRSFLRSAIRSAAGMSLAGAAALTYASQIEAWWFEVVRHELVLPGLPEAFAGFTIAQISDLHFGPFAGPADFTPAIHAVRSLEADAIVVTGDLVSRVGRGEPDMVVESLACLSAPYGVFAVLGSHDWSSNGPVVAESLCRAGVRVLRNEHEAWQRAGQKLYLAGVDDVCAHRHDLSAALDGVPMAARAVLLAHEPDFADIAAADSRVVLQLSGHSHGGQVCVPGYGGLFFPRWARKYPRGFYSIGSLTLYTNRGLGMMGLPLRLGCRPEISLFTLQPAPGCEGRCGNVRPASSAPPSRNFATVV
jgi:predicted MPP superfamily phosphohydrolase